MGKKNRKKRGKNKGQFRKGHDPRRRRGFTREEARRGYQSALAKCMKDIDKYAWLWRKLRKYFRSQGRWYPNLKGERDAQEESERRHFGPPASEPPGDEYAEPPGDDAPF